MSSDKPIGPALPPMFRREESDEDSDDDGGFSGPALPPGYKRGGPSSSSDDSEQEVTVKRAKTRHTAAEKEENTKEEEKEDDDDGFFGPALPPGFKKQQSSPDRRPVLGPALPPGFRRAVYENDDGEDEDDFQGPALPPGYQAESSSSEGEDEDVIGPMPSKGPVEDSVALDFERRAQRMKEKLTGSDAPEVLARETWMTELPPELQHIGLGARTFKKKSGPENKDRSMWTDTPADRERKARERLERKQKGEVEKDDVPQLSQKDVEMAEKVSKYNESKRAESLVSMHTKKMKEKAKEKADKPVERRPFDRDEDLQVNRFDEAQKQRLLKKSQELNTRFSHSRDRMFL
ncbi:GPALPP motifs-containing protein 1 [Epinephelus lanceolatus]|uniref:GPALPP motifs-containing protein 1 n=1 Tax=Epinephelus lanceolatus TaxID=310571 RepID=UPI001445CE77|nr:GPALPP motifs-containing protein 1 [Epinephelus lanceolatus]